MPAVTSCCLLLVSQLLGERNLICKLLYNQGWFLWPFSCVSLRSMKTVLPVVNPGHQSSTDWAADTQQKPTSPTSQIQHLSGKGLSFLVHRQHLAVYSVVEGTGGFLWHLYEGHYHQLWEGHFTDHQVSTCGLERETNTAALSHVKMRHGVLSFRELFTFPAHLIVVRNIVCPLSHTLPQHTSFLQRMSSSHLPDSSTYFSDGSTHDYLIRDSEILEWPLHADW